MDIPSANRRDARCNSAIARRRTEALTNAAAQASAERGHEFAAVYLRLALNLNDTPAAQVALGQALERAGLDAAARTAYSRVGLEDPMFYAAARFQLAASLEEDGRSEDALAELRRAAEVSPADPRVALMLAGQLMSMNRNASRDTSRSGASAPTTAAGRRSSMTMKETPGICSPSTARTARSA